MNLFIYWLCCVLVATLGGLLITLSWGYSLVAVCRRLIVVASPHCGGFFCCEAQASGCVSSQLLQLPGSRARVPCLWCTGLVAPGYVESSWTTDRTHVHCSGRQILMHYAMREVQILDILDEFFHLNSSL